MTKPTPIQEVDHQIVRPTKKVAAPKESKTTSPFRMSTVPRIMVSQDGKKLIPVCVDQNNANTLLMKAIGTNDSDFLQGVICELGTVCSREDKIDEERLNFMLSIIKGNKPRDQTEAMLAAAIAVTYAAMMKFAVHVANAEIYQEIECVGNIFNKLGRTLAIQIDGLARYRSGGDVHKTTQNISVNEGGQAIVANVTKNGHSTPLATTPQNVPMPPMKEANTKL